MGLQAGSRGDFSPVPAAEPGRTGRRDDAGGEKWACRRWVAPEVASEPAGRFRVEPLAFHLAGIPSYLVVGELALSRVLRGQLPSPAYPAALRSHAPGAWWQKAELSFGYARNGHARHGRLTECAGLLAVAACQSAHAVLAARGHWPTNEKTLLARAGLRELDQLIANLSPGPAALAAAAGRARNLCEAAVHGAIGPDGQRPAP